VGPVLAFVDALELFKIGYSWAGVTSLAMAYDLHSAPNRSDYGARIVRLATGGINRILYQIPNSLSPGFQGRSPWLFLG
jgi:hypothetical protein